MFSVVIYRSVIESNRIEFSQWSQIAFEITCKLLHDHDNILDGWINTAIAGRFSDSPAHLFYIVFLRQLFSHFVYYGVNQISERRLGNMKG